MWNIRHFENIWMKMKKKNLYQRWAPIQGPHITKERPSISLSQGSTVWTKPSVWFIKTKKIEVKLAVLQVVFLFEECKLSYSRHDVNLLGHFSSNVIANHASSSARTWERLRSRDSQLSLLSGELNNHNITILAYRFTFTFYFNCGDTMP